MNTNDLKQQRYRDRFIILHDKVGISCGARVIDRVILLLLIALLWKRPALARDPKNCDIGLLWYWCKELWLYVPVSDSPPAGDVETMGKVAFA